MPLKHLCTTQALVPEALFNHFEGFRSTFPKVGTKFDEHSLFLSLIHHENRHGSRTQLRTNVCKPAHVILPMLNLACWLTKHGSPTIYRCFTLPQLLYRWWHEYGKFWINPFILRKHSPKCSHTCSSERSDQKCNAATHKFTWKVSCPLQNYMLTYMREVATVNWHTK